MYPEITRPNAVTAFSGKCTLYYLCLNKIFKKFYPKVKGLRINVRYFDAYVSEQCTIIISCHYVCKGLTGKSVA